MEVSQKPFARKKPEQLVYLELGSGNGGMLLSVSEDGFCFRAVAPLRPNALVPFAFSFDGANRLQGVGEVEWLEGDAKSGGMRFVEVSQEFRDGLDRWLALESHRPSGREVTPAAAAPLDSMEKIREEIRRGTSQATQPARSPQAPEPQAPEPQAAEPQDPPARVLFPSQGTEATPLASKPQPTSETKRQPSSVAAPNGPEAKPESKPAPESAPEPDRKPTRTVEMNAAFADAPPGSLPKMSLPKPTTQELQPSKGPEANSPPTESSAQRPAPAMPARPVFPQSASPPAADPMPQSGETPSAPSTPLPLPSDDWKQPRPDVRSLFSQVEETETNQSGLPHPASLSESREPGPLATQLPSVPSPRPAVAPKSRASAKKEILQTQTRRSESVFAAPERPYIPPPDDYFEPVWENGRLVPVPETPHLSRVAAGGIIGLALAVIVGALAFTFRQEIGAFVVQLGQTISGGTPSPSAPSVEAAPQRPSEQAQQPRTGGSAQNASQQTSDGGKDRRAGGAETAGQAGGNPTTFGGSAASSTPDHTANPSGGTSSTAPTPLETNPANPAEGSSDTQTIAESATGQGEFEAAREVLRGKNRQRDLSRAVELLWSSVRKGYVPAEVTLADMYMRGEGVPKTCDQAQVLLVAASRKGSAEARRMLEQMAERGCTD